MAIFQGLGRFDQDARWLCWPPHGKVCIISGPLAEILSRHLEFDLKFIAFDEDGLSRWHGRQHKTSDFCEYCQEVAEAYPPPEFVEATSLYMLRHKCGTVFAPKRQHRLYSRSEGHKFEDLMIGNCPKRECAKADVMGYVTVDCAGEPIRYEPINWTKHKDWINRLDADLVPGPDNRKHGTVKGCVQDRLSGKWRYKEVIEVK